jgi:RimJ/RimL family protein N-acetyltransferase
MSRIIPFTVPLPSGELLTIRNPEGEDALALMATLNSVTEEEQFLLLEPGELDLSLEEELAWIFQRNNTDGEIYLMGVLNNEIIGGISLLREPFIRRRHLVRLGMFVAQAHRGKGVGKALMQGALDWAAQQPQIEKIILDVFTHNEPAIGLYRRFGFEAEGRLVRHTKTAHGEYFDEISMALWMTRGV